MIFNEYVHVNDTTFLLSSPMAFFLRKTMPGDYFRALYLLEAVGTLAGGVAHDFNNLLQAILGYTQILAMGREENDPDLARLRQIENSAMRASELTQQLLAFSRKVESKLRPVDFNLEVKQVQKLLKRTIPKMISMVEDEKPKQQDEPEKEAQIKGGEETILLVDDEELLRDIGKETLEEFGYRVITAPDGESCLQLYAERKQEISLIILDLMMPGMGGGNSALKISSPWRLMRRLSSRAGTPSTVPRRPLLKQVQKVLSKNLSNLNRCSR